MFDLRKLHPRYWNPRLLWDLFMVWVAIINLSLIVFDLTYLMARPYYVRYATIVCRVYDPVKGIRPHPLTEELLKVAGETRQLLELDSDSPGLADRVAQLRLLTVRVLEENPFERSGQTLTLEVLKLTLARQAGATTIDLYAREPMLEAVNTFWTEDAVLLARNLDLFDARVRPLLQDNYFRRIDLDGHLVDHFWLLDLPFLTLFLVEFAVRWAAAIRRRSYARWYFFPIFNWYDVLGLIPYTQFRVFRLFRLASIYMRLRRSELSRVGKDVLSRAVAYVSNIIAEEISDVVSLRILNETQDEIRDGTHVRIFDRTVLPRRDEIGDIAVTQVRRLLASEEVQERMRSLVRLNLEHAVTSSDTLRAVPLPSAVLRPVTRAVGEAVLDSTVQAITVTLETENGRQAARQVIGSVLDEVLTGPLRAEIQDLAANIALDVIERMKEAVSVKKWARPDPSGTPPPVAE